nr:MAG TPA: phosphotyrosine phosphatase [Caudoviricetes sp.]
MNIRFYRGETDYIGMKRVLFVCSGNRPINSAKSFV